MPTGSIIVDRRGEKERSVPNRERLKRRIDQQIKDAIPDIIHENNITDIGKDGKGIRIPIKGLDEPTLQNDGELGRRHRVYTGNDRFRTGDQIPKPLQEGGGGSKEASDSPETGEDEFGIELSRDEFLEYFYKDLELPYMEERKKATSVDTFRWKHAGHIKYGVPARLNVIRSMSGALGRRIALKAVYEQRIKALEERLATASEDEKPHILEAIEEATRFSQTVPYVEEVDLRYDHFVKEPVPIDSAVMFCLMDVSGSMSQEEKDIAKRFYFFLYLMLEKNYKQVDVVWIRHHTAAERVDEHKFFHERETGGTIVSSALKLADDIKNKGDEWSPGGYPTSNWNIYFAQASDGDNWYSDYGPACDLLRKLVAYSNYYAYIQIRSPAEENLWQHYAQVAEQYPRKFQMKHINDKKEIWKVFRELFEKRHPGGAGKFAAFGKVA